MLIKLGAGGTDLTRLHPMMRKVHAAVTQEFPSEPVITETWGGTHSSKSLHPFGCAEDYRLPWTHNQGNVEVIKKLREKLGKDFDIILHDTHIHIEYDPK